MSDYSTHTRALLLLIKELLVRCQISSRDLTAAAKAKKIFLDLEIQDETMNEDLVIRDKKQAREKKRIIFHSK